MDLTRRRRSFFVFPSRGGRCFFTKSPCRARRRARRRGTDSLQNFHQVDVERQILSRQGVIHIEGNLRIRE